MKKWNKTMNFRNPRGITVKRQAGLTLIETMISIALSLVVTSAMVVLMANSLGSATRGIHMTQLTDELRNAMSMMTRDVRRANYSAYSIFCFGNSHCGDTGGLAEQLHDVLVNADRDCFRFALDRGFNGDASDDALGAFRRVTVARDGQNVGVIEMWTGAAGATPNCDAGAGAANWVALTDPSRVNVTLFDIDNTGSVEKEINESPTSSFISRQREIQISLEGQLVLEDAMNNNVVERVVSDTIYVRNDFIRPVI